MLFNSLSSQLSESQKSKNSSIKFNYFNASTKICICLFFPFHFIWTFILIIAPKVHFRRVVLYHPFFKTFQTLDGWFSQNLQIRPGPRHLAIVFFNRADPCRLFELKKAGRFLRMPGRDADLPGKSGKFHSVLPNYGKLQECKSTDFPRFWTLKKENFENFRRCAAREL